MRKKFAVVAATTALLAGGALATASSASAAPSPPDSGGWDHTWYTADTAHGGTIYIEEHGDVVYLCDSAADGYAPRAQISALGSTGAYQQKYLLTASGGNGSCTSHRASQGGASDLPENDSISVGMWLGSIPPLYGTTHYFVNDH